MSRKLSNAVLPRIFSVVSGSRLWSPLSDLSDEKTKAQSHQERRFKDLVPVGPSSELLPHFRVGPGT